MIKKILLKLLKMMQIYSLIILGSFLVAMAINLFLAPNKIAAGGVSGIATIIYYISNQKFPIGVTMFVLNIPLFIIGMKSIGKTFIFRTFIGMVFLSVVIDISVPITNRIFNLYIMNSDNMLISVFGGVIMGTGLGLVFRAGATTGGSDMAVILLNKLVKKLSVGQILMIIDASVIISAAVAFKSFNLAMYALIALYITTKSIDFIMEGVNFSKAVFIISDKWEDIANKILTDMDRGITVLKGKGMYTGIDRMVLLCIIYRGQLNILKQIVKSIDSHSFVIVTDVREVLGEGFKNYDQVSSHMTD